jgi:hypothetical protein
MRGDVERNSGGGDPGIANLNWPPIPSRLIGNRCPCFAESVIDQNDNELA